MKKSKFLDLLKGQEEIKREILLTFSTLNQDHVTKVYADRWHVTKNIHVEEDHVDGQHVIWNFNSEDYIDSQHVTGIITAKDHDNRHHITDTTVA